MPWLRKVFSDSASTFGVVSLVFLVSLAIAPAKTFHSEWRHYQNRYRKLIRTRADGVSLEKRMPHGIQQIWIPEQGVVDRCTTCHIALKNGGLEDVGEQPFRPHPPIPHSLDQFGCVICHRGQGVATTAHEAHRSSLAWEEPILPAKYMEASCGQCHISQHVATSGSPGERVPAWVMGTPQLYLGRELLGREGCVRCHTLKMADGTLMQATDDPPSLRHIAEKTTREWIYAWLKDPQSYSSTTTMPNFHFSDDALRDISAFMMAQSTPSASGSQPAVPGQSAKEDSQGPEGASLYGQLFCASCHAVQNAAGNLVGGNFGPELTKIGSKAKPEWLQAWLRKPGNYDSDTKMPHYRFTEQQIATLTTYLEAKKDDDLLANVHLQPATTEQVNNGRKLVIEHGCSSCHEINGIKRPENFAPELTRIGSKPLAQIAFPAQAPHTLPDFIAAKVRDPRAFGPGLKMPQFHLGEREIDAITTALLAQTERAATQSATMRTMVAPDTTYQPSGGAGELIRDLRCFSCHRFNGRGGDMAPDLSWEGSAVQRKWLAEFLKNPETLRPALIRRMPKFNLRDEEINTLTDYIMTVYQTPAFNRDQSPVHSTPALVAQGRELFYAKYACQSCHIVDPAKDKGYIGPALWAVGGRLNAAWIYRWLKDPQSLRPGALEPNQHMNDDDALALTAFLSSLQSKGGRKAAVGGAR